jgi:hypothetical protein
LLVSRRVRNILEILGSSIPDLDAVPHLPQIVTTTSRHCIG